MKKILVANRGEIACRIIDSCKKLNLHSIAVYSDVDKNSKHVRKANESVHIGASKAQDSYLSSNKIIEAAKKANTIANSIRYQVKPGQDSFGIWALSRPTTNRI